MAARVNVKFVIILSAVLVCVCGGAVGAWYFVVNKTGDSWARQGDQAMAAADYEAAAQAYERAVGHEKTNLDWLNKWRDALEARAPDEQGAYQRLFSNKLVPVIRQIAQVKRTDIEAHDEFLALTYEQVRDSGNPAAVRNGAEAINAQTESVMPLFGGDPGPHDRLRRYRGLAFTQVLGRVGTLPENEMQRTEEDLRAALAADPADGEVAVAITQLLSSRIDEAKRAERITVVDRYRTEAREVIDTLLENDPDDPWGRVFKFAIELDQATDRLRGNNRPPEVVAREIRAVYQEFLPRLDDLHAWLMQQPPETLDRAVLDRFQLLETVTDPEARLGRTAELVTRLAKAQPEDARLGLRYAQLIADQGELDNAITELDRIIAMEPKKLSFEGWVQFLVQAQAARSVSEFQLRKAEGIRNDGGPAAQVDAAMAAAKDARQKYALMVQQGNSELKFLDGLIALAENRPVDAIAQFAAYNEDTTFQNRLGLWREAQVARGLGRLGTARDRLQQLLDLEPQNAGAVLALAQVEEAFGEPVNLRRAIELCRTVLRLQPGNETAQNMIERYEIMLGDRPSEDPVVTLIYQAQRIARGADDELGNAQQAMDLLRSGLEPNGWDTRVVNALGGMLLNAGRLDEARELVDEALPRNPDNEQLRRLSVMLQADSVTDAVAMLIDESDAPEEDKLLRKHQVYIQAGEPERATEMLDQLIEVAPNDPRVLELRFVRAIQQGRLDEAERLTGQAEQYSQNGLDGADGMGGVTFRARLAAAKGNEADAVRFFEEAAQSGRADAAIWRALGISQRTAGRTADAIRSFQRALSIRPDDVATINAYIATLAGADQLDEALSEARRLRPQAERSTEFMDLYLTLEAGAGGREGIRRAIQQRRRIMTEQPGNIRNRIALANLFIEDRQWLEARGMIDALRAENDSLELVALDARWHADQGRVRTADGFRDGIDMAQEVFVRYIVSQDDQNLGVDAYLTLARFMIQRGQYGVAVRAIGDARPLQDPKQLRAEKLNGDLMLTLGRAEEAAESFRKIVAAGADDADQSYRKRLIEMLLRQSLFDEAADQVAALGDEFQQDLTVMLQRTDILLGQGKRQEALDLLNKAVALHQDSAVVYAKRAQVLLSQESGLNDALADLQTALEIQPNEWRTLRLRAAVYYQMGRTEDAIADLRSTIRANPTLDEVLLGLMIELINQGRDGEALDAASEVIDQRPTDTTLMITAGRILSDRGKWSRAAILYGKAWELSQNPDLAIRYIDSLVNSEPPRPDEAERVLRRVAELGADINADPELLIAQALIERARNRPVRAESFLVQAFDAQDDSPTARLNWIRNVVRVYNQAEPGSAVNFLRQLARSREAGSGDAEWLEYAAGRLMMDREETFADGESRLQELAESANTETVRLLSHRTLGAMHYDREDFDKAEAAWQAGLAEFPDDWEMTNNLAYCIGRDQNRPADALPLARKAVELAAGESQAWDTLARIHIALGNLDDAEAALDQGERAIRTASARINITINRARLEAKRGRCELARSLLSQARTSSEALPQLREQFQTDIQEVLAMIQSGC